MLIFAAFGILVLMAFMCIALTVGVVMFAGSGVHSGVSVAGMGVGGLSEEEAAERIAAELTTISLRDGERTWQVNLADFGVTVDAKATAKRAYEQGRGEGSLLDAMFGTVNVNPVISIDPVMLQQSLEAIKSQVDVAPLDAGVGFVDGQVKATDAVDGRSLNVEQTMVAIENHRSQALVDGTINLVMSTVSPQITDSSAMVAAASQLLRSPLTIRAFDPKTGDSVYWIAQPETWARWLTAHADADSPIGLRLSLRGGEVETFLQEQARIFDSSRYLDLEEAVSLIQKAVTHNETDAIIRVYHHDLEHVVQPGESIVSIAYDYGIPYPYVQQANPGADALIVGQTITIPSIDTFLHYDPVPDKRIVVSISEQRTRVYENGEMIWDWPSSTGIANSPTWPGIYQIISHETNAYAANWDLWMPNFMGVYQPIPGADFTNGFHGFPTRGGGQLLWENNLGSPVTYGCILLSNGNILHLYEWAETGVIVEILP